MKGYLQKKLDLYLSRTLEINAKLYMIYDVHLDDLDDLDDLDNSDINLGVDVDVDKRNQRFVVPRHFAAIFDHARHLHTYS